jgi:DNA-binding NarL/FixJ family response regulator
VVVVDDEPLVASAFARLIKLAGFSVVVLHNPLEVANVVKLLQPTAVVSDLRMPGLNGLGVLRLVRLHAPEARLVLVSGTLQDVRPEDLHGLWPIDLLPKPPPAGSLLAAIRSRR